MIHGLQRDGSGCAIVLDEYGGVAGAVFLDDALEEIVGPLPDEFDNIEVDHHEVGPGVYELKGEMALPFACEVLNIDIPGDEDTIGGYIVSLLRRIPEVDDTIDVGPYRCTVTEVRNHLAYGLRFERITSDADLG
jgi:CBS domain containing-hemolysin-like protein